MIIARLFLATCAAGGLIAADVPAVDLLGGAGFTDTYIGLGLSVSDDRARDAERDFTSLKLSASLNSVSGYPAPGHPSVGGLFGGMLMAQAWAANDRDVNWAALAPSLSLVGGGFWKTTDSLRFNLTGEAGPGLAFSRFDDGSGGSSSDIRPCLHAGAHIGVMMRTSPRSDLGLIFGYEYDYLPEVTSEGPVLLLAFTWNPTAGAVDADK
jgi:hypothetical protein